MKIHNIRLGYATNSSSSHSMIFDPQGKYFDDFDEDSFGWDYFTAASPEARARYIASTLVQNLGGELPDALIMAILKGLNLPLNTPGIDHQSVFNLPAEFGSKLPDLAFFDEFRQYIMRDGVVILGGNDNNDEDHPLFDETKQMTFNGWEPESYNSVCRKDGDWWTIYNLNSGNRVVLSFKDDPAPFQPLTPMLVDIKITDYCTHGCSFCYQGSTADGKHMDRNNIWHYANMLAEGKVFEIAIGGGEPTQCEFFEEFLHYTHQNGIVNNFTTKSTDWLEDERRANVIMPLIGAFAYSAGEYCIDTLNRIKTIMDYRRYDRRKFTIQVVPATMSKYQLESILTWASQNYVRTTLLGFKETGRGGKFKEIAIKRSWDKFDETSWLDVLVDLNAKDKLGTISIDTTLASRYEKQLQAISLPSWLYHIQEGKYSLYIDSVNHKAGPSSYHLDKLIDIDKTQELSSIFVNIEPV